MSGLLLSPREQKRWGKTVKDRASAVLEQSGISDAIATIVYGLTDSAGEIRYVGCCSNGLGYRLVRHLDYAARGKDWRVSTWLRSIDYQPGLVILAVDPPEPRKVELEWIHRLLAAGNDLTNYCGTPTSEMQKKAATAANIKRFSDPAEREKISVAMRLRGSMPGHPHSEETKAKLSAMFRGIPKSEAHKAAMRAGWARRKAVIRDGSSTA